MSSATVFIFAPVEEARDSHTRLEAEGCELRLGKASWDTPQGNGEPELIRMAQGAHALMGTSIRNVPISRKIMESSPELRVIAKYTIGVDDVDVEAATEMGILVCHGPTESNWGGVAEGRASRGCAGGRMLRWRLCADWRSFFRWRRTGPRACRRQGARNGFHCGAGRRCRWSIGRIR